MSQSDTRIGGGEVAAIAVPSGAILRVTNVLGGQVVDAWFYAEDDWDQFASMSHSRAALRTVRPSVGDTFVTCRREPLITIVADTSPGIHDMTMPPCDPWRYEQLGAPGHANCADNLRAAMASAGRHPPAALPDPLNLFQNSPVGADGSITFLESPAPTGSHIDLRAHRNIRAVLSACPMDIMPINGGAPRQVAVSVLDSEEGQ